MVAVESPIYWNACHRFSQFGVRQCTHRYSFQECYESGYCIWRCLSIWRDVSSMGFISADSYNAHKIDLIASSQPIDS